MIITIDFADLDYLVPSLRSHKVVHLTNVPYRGNDLLKFYSDMLPKLGKPVPMDEDLASEDKTGNFWIEIRYNPAFPMSYRHADVRQPLHTDGSYESDAPDISFFFCYTQAKFGGATTFIDSKLLVDVLNYYDSEFLLTKLRDYPVTFTKGKDSKTRPIIREQSGDYLLTWNYFRVFKDPGFCLDFHTFLEKKIVEGGLLTPVMLREGEAVFFNDERVLHGRNSFIGNRFLLKGGIKL